MEYKIINGNQSDMQKVLNQWKHQYILNILHAQVYRDADGEKITILLTREEIK